MTAPSSSSSSWRPEESFQSWSDYRRAVLATPARLKDRVLARALVSSELTDVKGRSAVDLKRRLTWWDFMWCGIGTVVGAGIFVITALEARVHTGAAVVLSYGLAGFSAMLSVFCYTEFAVEIPVAYLRVELGDVVAFIGAGSVVLEYVIGSAAIARGWTSFFASLLYSGPDVSDRLRITTNLAEGYNKLDPIVLGVLILVGVLASWSTKGTSYANWIASLGNMVIIAFVIVAGPAHALPANLTTEFLHFGARGDFSAEAVLFFAYLGYLGFDAVATLAEEVKNPARDIPIGLVGSIVGSMIVCTLNYMLMALTLTMMVPFAQIDTGAPFSAAFASVGWTWAKYIVALGALKGITTVLLVSAVGQARYLTDIARAHLIPPWFALVNKTTQTPINATVVMVLASGVVGFFTDLPILGNLLSMSSLFIFFLVAVALLVRRYYVPNHTGVRHGALFSIYLGLIVASSIAIAAYWGLNGSGYVLYVVCSVAWLLATLAMAVTLKQLRKPATWGVPLVPWLPSLSIALNIFLLGCLDRASFVRFGVWTAIILVYYFVFGMHASYDAAGGGGGGDVAAAKQVRNEEDLGALLGERAVTGPTPP